MLRMSDNGVLIIGGGVTGLASGVASGLPVYEMTDAPGGLCASYYMVPGSNERLYLAPPDEEAYRFEIGGGHWIWGGDPLMLHFMKSLTRINCYTRNAAVYMPDQGICVPYPIQNHLSYLGSDVAKKAVCEMVEATPNSQSATTMAEWLRTSFGETLCELFFDPFHKLYTAGLWEELAPQDESKSP